jgi:type I restriction enzyme S subunit
MRGSEDKFPTELRGVVKMSLVAASRLATAQFRLDAAAFLSQDHLSAVMPGTFRAQQLSQLADVFTVYIQSPVLAYVSPFPQSLPYKTTSELAEYQMGHSVHVSLVADPRLIDWQIKKGNIVVSRSGRVGEAYWVDKRLDGALVGDSFRVVPKNPEDGPFIFAVLSSSFARNFLSGSAYGSVVDHASLDQLRRFPVPYLATTATSKISEAITKGLAARERAYDLLDEAQIAVLHSCGLAFLNNDSESNCNGHVDQVIVNIRELIQATPGDSEFRLEAHFYNAFARSVIADIKNCPVNKRTVGELTYEVIMGGRFKRNYVGEAYGTPFLSGKNIVQIRPTDLKYLSNSETQALDDSILKRNWVLVTRSGTIGRTCFVWNNFEDYAASEHILRVIPDESRVDPGYLYALLSSPYGYEQIVRFRHGSVIDEITDEQIKKVLVPLPEPRKQREIGDMVRLAYEKRAEALKLEDEAQQIMMREIDRKTAKET